MHPFAFVTVTEYVVVEAGVTVMLAVVAELLHEYEVPPLAVRVALAPLHIETVAGKMLAVGFEFTVTVRDIVAVQLFALVTVTVYVVVVAGFTVILAVVPALLHE